MTFLEALKFQNNDPFAALSGESDEERAYLDDRIPRFRKVLKALRSGPKPKTRIEQNLRTAELLFNAGLFFDSHEFLEGPWKDASNKMKPFLQGLIQAAAAFHKLELGSPEGCRTLLARAAEKLRAAEPPPGARSDAFVRELEAAAARLDGLGLAPEDAPAMSLYETGRGTGEGADPEAVRRRANEFLALAKKCSVAATIPDGSGMKAAADAAQLATLLAHDAAAEHGLAAIEPGFQTQRIVLTLYEGVGHARTLVGEKFRRPAAGTVSGRALLPQLDALNDRLDALGTELAESLKGVNAAAARRFRRDGTPPEDPGSRTGLKTARRLADEFFDIVLALQTVLRPVFLEYLASRET